MRDYSSIGQSSGLINRRFPVRVRVVPPLYNTIKSCYHISMIHLNQKLPKTFYLAFSGGVDSLAAAHFLSRSNKRFALLHFHHGCEFSDEIQEQVAERADKLGILLLTGKIKRHTVPEGRSLEEYWRTERYAYLKAMATPEMPVLTCHHLDDAVESWVWSAMHGKPHLIKPKTNNGTTLRPFLLTEKAAFTDYAVRNGLEPVDDPVNRDGHLIRNYIRANMLPHAYHINPGLKKVIRKKYLELADG